MKNGNEITFMTLIQDITENKQFEERLEQCDLSLREARAIAHIGSWEIDLLANQKFGLMNYPKYGVFKKQQFHKEDWV